MLMSGCGQGHELAKNIRKRLWLKFPGLTVEVKIQVKESVYSAINRSSVSKTISFKNRYIVYHY